MCNEKQKGRIDFFLLLRLLGIILFIVILSRVDFSAAFQHIKNVKLLFLLFGILFQLLLLFTKACRWHLLNDGRFSRIAVFQSFGEFFESYAIGVVTPGRMGELIKAGYAKEKSKMFDAGLKVLIERGFDLGFFLVLAGIGLFIYPKIENNQFFGILVFLTGLSGILAALLLMVNKRSLGFIEKILHSIKLLKKDLSLQFKRRPIKESSLIVLFSLISNLSYFASCYLLALGLRLDISFLHVSLGVAIAGLFNMLPITVMGLGTREATFLFVFESFSESVILALSGLVFFVAQVGGGLMALLLGMFFLHHARTGFDKQYYPETI